MKQTAVEWLVDQYKKVGGISISMTEQAKEMEKEQIQDAFYYGVDVDSFNEHFPYQAAERYYNETYEQNLPKL